MIINFLTAILIKISLQSLALLLSFCLERVWEYQEPYQREETIYRLEFRYCPQCGGSGKVYSPYRIQSSRLFDPHADYEECPTCEGRGGIEHEIQEEVTRTYGGWSLSSGTYLLIIVTLLSLLIPPGLFWVITWKIKWSWGLLDIPILLIPTLFTIRRCSC